MAVTKHTLDTSKDITMKVNFGGSPEVRTMDCTDEQGNILNLTVDKQFLPGLLAALAINKNPNGELAKIEIAQNGQGGVHGYRISYTDTNVVW